MLIYVLTLTLVFLLIIAYSSSGQDLFYPWVIVIASFLNSTVLAMLNLDYWQYGFHEETCLVISSALVIFGIGAMLASHFLSNKCKMQDEKKVFYDIPPLIPVALFFIFIAMAVAVFSNMYAISLDYGNSGGIKGVLPTLRKLIEARLLSLPKMQIYSSIIVLPTALFFTYAFLYNLFSCGFSKRSLFYLLPLLAYVPHIILSTGRLEFLSITVMIILMAGILYQNKYGISLRSNLRIFSFMLVALMLFFAVFLGVGSFTWKGMSAEHGPFKILSHYTGTQIPAFDVFLQNHYPEDDWIGEHTLIGPYGNLKALGVAVPEASMFMEFTHFANVDTNVYTSLRRYIQDYGYVGMSIVVFLLGLIYTSFYHLVRHGKGGNYGLLLYFLLSWPLFLFGHDDLVLTGIISTRTIYYMIILGVLCFWLGRYRKAI